MEHKWNEIQGCPRKKTNLWCVRYCGSKNSNVNLGSRDYEQCSYNFIICWLQTRGRAGPVISTSGSFLSGNAVKHSRRTRDSENNSLIFLLENPRRVLLLGFAYETTENEHPVSSRALCSGRWELSITNFPPAIFNGALRQQKRFPAFVPKM